MNCRLHQLSVWVPESLKLSCRASERQFRFLAEWYLNSSVYSHLQILPAPPQYGQAPSTTQLFLASSIHLVGPSLATGPSVPYSPLSCRSDLESIGSSHSSCQNGFPSFRVNSKGPSTCSFPSVYISLLPDSHRALSLTSFRLLLQGLFLWEACSDHAIKKKVASSAVTSCSIFLPLGTSFLVVSLRAGAWSQPLLHPHHLQPCLAHCRCSENYICWTKIWITVRPFVFINTNPPENFSELNTIIIAEEMSTNREIKLPQNRTVRMGQTLNPSPGLDTGKACALCFRLFSMTRKCIDWHVWGQDTGESHQWTMFSSSSIQYSSHWLHVAI